MSFEHALKIEIRTKEVIMFSTSSQGAGFESAFEAADKKPAHKSTSPSSTVNSHPASPSQEGQIRAVGANLSVEIRQGEVVDRHPVYLVLLSCKDNEWTVSYRFGHFKTFRQGLGDDAKVKRL